MDEFGLFLLPINKKFPYIFVRILVRIYIGFNTLSLMKRLPVSFVYFYLKSTVLYCVFFQVTVAD